MFNFLIKTAQAAYSFEENSGLKKTADKLGYSTSNISSPENAIAKGITYVLSFLGVIFLVLAIYAGILWMTSQGNEKTIEKAKDILINSVIGLVIVALAYVISYFVVSTFAKDYLN